MSVILFLLVLLTGCSLSVKEFSKIGILMGTTVEIKVWSFDETTAKKSISAAFNEITRVENIFSVYKPESEISQLNKNGSAIMSDEAVQLIKKSVYFSEISNGAFDITIMPIIELWKTAKKNGKLPTAEKITKVRQLVGSKNISIDEQNRKINFIKKGMKIDLGGIAKGYAVDKAVEILKKNRIKAGMINAGGDIRCFGPKVWKIALQNPRNKNDFITVLRISDKAVTTSGDYERYFEIDKMKISHIIDPLSGYPADKSISATIISDTATDADALATASFVLGAEKMIELYKKQKNFEYLLIDNEKKITKTAGFSNYE